MNNYLKIIALFAASILLIAFRRSGPAKAEDRFIFAIFIIIFLGLVLIIIHIIDKNKENKNKPKPNVGNPDASQISQSAIPRQPPQPQPVSNICKDIFNSLPTDKINCKECGWGSCVNFLNSFAFGTIPLDECPYISENIKNKYWLHSEHIKNSLGKKPNSIILNDISKSLPMNKRDCRECGFHSCYDFFNNIYLGKVTIDACPHVPQNKREKYYYLYRKT